MTLMRGNLQCAMADALSSLDADCLESVGKVEFDADGNWWRVEKGGPARGMSAYINPNMPLDQIGRLVQIKLAGLVLSTNEGG